MTGLIQDLRYALRQPQKSPGFAAVVAVLTLALPAAILLVAALATDIPVRRAAKVNPMVALRYE